MENQYENLELDADQEIQPIDESQIQEIISLRGLIANVCEQCLIGTETPTDDVADLAQETIIRVYSAVSSGRFREESTLLTYALRIAANLTLDHLRKRGRRRETSYYNNLQDSADGQKTLLDVLMDDSPMSNPEGIVLIRAEAEQIAKAWFF